MIQITDFSYVLSGGSANEDPNLSLGGDPSAHPVPPLPQNNLFENLTAEQSAAGLTSFRCVYLFNDHPTDSLYVLRAWILSQEESGADVQIGVEKRTEQQRVDIQGTATGGTVQVVYDGHSVPWAFNADTEVTSKNLQAALRVYDHFSLAFVSSQQNPTNPAYRSYLVTWNNGRYRPLLTFTGAWSGATMSVARTSSGSPVNSRAPEIADDTTAPSRVFFAPSSDQDPWVLGHLNPGDGLPFWLRRSVPANTDPSERDGFVLRFAGSPTDDPASEYV